MSVENSEVLHCVEDEYAEDNSFRDDDLELYADGDTDQEHFSLQDIDFDDISPEPAGGDFYGTHRVYASVSASTNTNINTNIITITNIKTITIIRP